MPDPPSRKLIIENRLAEVSRAEEFVLQPAERHGFAGADRFAVKLALQEALANAIKHGNRMDPRKRVVIECQFEGEELRITVCDEGEGFDPAGLPDPTLDENLSKPHGRGVMLMRTYMTDVRFSKAGTCVTLVKRRAPQSQHS